MKRLSKAQLELQKKLEELKKAERKEAKYLDKGGKKKKKKSKDKDEDRKSSAAAARALFLVEIIIKGGIRTWDISKQFFISTEYSSSRYSLIWIGAPMK